MYRVIIHMVSKPPPHILGGLCLGNNAEQRTPTFNSYLTNLGPIRRIHNGMYATFILMEDNSTFACGTNGQGMIKQVSNR